MSRRLAEIAEKVGVSEATVSRVLNERPGVSEATRQTVLTALDVMGYERPSKLRGQRARLIGLVLPELQNPIFPALADIVGGALAQQGFTPVLCTRTAGGMSEADYVDLLLQQHVSGVVFIGGQCSEADAPHDHYRWLRDRNLPVVLVNGSAIDTINFPQISTDDAVAVEQSLDYLLALGHRRIGLVLGPADHIPSRRKLAGFRAAGAKAGIDVSDDVIQHTLFSLEGGQAAATRLVERGLTGIICASDLLALGVIRAVRRSGREVPDDVSVIGFDDSALMTCVDPPLTTVRQPIDAMGKAAVSLLVSQVDGTPATQEELLYEPELVVRRSTAPVAATG